MDFKDYPKTINEIKSDQSNKAADWTARDLLIYLLREIDSGNLHAENIIVCVQKENEIFYRFAGENKNSQNVGLLETVKHLILTGG